MEQKFKSINFEVFKTYDICLYSLDYENISFCLNIMSFCYTDIYGYSFGVEHLIKKLLGKGLVHKNSDHVHYWCRNCEALDGKNTKVNL